MIYTLPRVPHAGRMQTLRPQDWGGWLFRRTCEHREAGRRKRYRSQSILFGRAGMTKYLIDGIILEILW